MSSYELWALSYEPEATSCELKSQASGLKPQAFWGLLVKIVIAPDSSRKRWAAGEWHVPSAGRPPRAA